MSVLDNFPNQTATRLEWGLRQSPTQCLYETQPKKDRLLMEEILHHQGCIEPCKSCGIYMYLPYQLVIAGFLPSVSLHLFVAGLGLFQKDHPQNNPTAKSVRKISGFFQRPKKSQVQQLQDPHHQYHPRSDKSQFDLRHLKARRHPPGQLALFSLFPQELQVLGDLESFFWGGGTHTQEQELLNYSEMATKCFKFHNNKGNYCHTEKFIDRQGQHYHHINIQRILMVVLSKSTSFPEFPAGKTYWIPDSCVESPLQIYTLHKTI